jgi:hypothetical protein
LTMCNRIGSMKHDVRKAARIVAYQWPTIVEAEDVEQEIYVRLLSSPASVDKLLDDFDAKNRVSALISMGHQIAAKERTDYEVFSGNFRYSVNEVKKLLTNRKNGIGKSTTGADLEAGMERLRQKNNTYHELIQRRYVLGERIEGSESSALSRALTALATHMNHYHKKQHAERSDGPGTRKAISSERARWISNNQYNGQPTNPGPGSRQNYQDFKPFSFVNGERL